MRYSQLFGKTLRDTSGQIQVASHKWLVQGGFIRESVAGRYFYLPLGMRVKQKVMQVIRTEMDRAGAQEMIAPILHPLELWQETNRDRAGNFGLTLVTDRRGGQFALGGTAEEMFVDVVRRFPISYRDLPFTIYQFSQKFRDELRARGGLLRVREFTMKDAYSFDRDATTFAATYEQMLDTYSRIFARLGLNPHIVPADNGYIGGDYSHEFVVESDVGETLYLLSADGNYCAHEDVAEFYIADLNLDETAQPLEVIEQPTWVKTIADMGKFHNLPAARFLKNVAYKNIETDEIVIAVIRGDLNVNKTKLEHAVGAPEQLTPATAADLARIGTRSGYVPSWGVAGVRTVGDSSLQTVRNFVGGQKTDTTDTRHVNYGRDFVCDHLADIALAEVGHVTKDGHQPLIEKRGIEVGNTFQLGYHYSQLMARATFTDEDGAARPYFMGCYGIGIGRTLQAIAEVHRDERGIIWPESVAPYGFHLISLGRNDDAERLYQQLLAWGMDVLYDDREHVAAGVKFADADLIGCPVRLVISKRTGDQIEWKRRDESEGKLVTWDALPLTPEFLAVAAAQSPLRHQPASSD